jgi:hypothetical protein
MLSAAGATAAVLAVTPLLGVQGVDGDQTQCAAGGLAQWGGHDQYIPSMTASPPKRLDGFDFADRIAHLPSGPATRITASRSRLLGTNSIVLSFMGASPSG